MCMKRLHVNANDVFALTCRPRTFLCLNSGLCIEIKTAQLQSATVVTRLWSLSIRIRVLLWSHNVELC